MTRLKLVVLLIPSFFFYSNSRSQSAWPSENWEQATNLTLVMNQNGLNDLSGMHWNSLLNRLFMVQDNGKLRVLELNTGNNSFYQIANADINGGPEDITQADFSKQEFFVVDENNYQIGKYVYNADFSSVSEVNSWNLLNPPSTMANTGNSGPEGIAFVPDEFLTAIGFISEQTGNLYVSAKGMGGLMFVASQDFGLIWVFDLNPEVNDDFAFVGKYFTNKSESCDLEFDRSTGLLYILHNMWKSNPDNNFLEVTDLNTTSVNVSDRKFVKLNEYYISNPSSNANIEGFAITPKCSNNSNVSVWLCRDVDNAAPSEELKDCIRWFDPFTSDGNCDPNSVEKMKSNKYLNLKVFPNPAHNYLIISLEDTDFKNARALVYNYKNELVAQIENINGQNYTLEIAGFKPGLYFIVLNQQGKKFREIFVKE
ncbi:MAG: T9SS type A sorting domain-containing protein [Bacteroidales bacterium]